MRKPPVKIAVAALALAGLGLTGGTAAASAAVHPAGISAATTTFTAATKVTAHPDSGTQGDNWANDNFTRTATIHRVNQVSVSNCPGSGTGTCWFYTGTLTDSGTFTTVSGVASPRTSTLLDQSLTGQFAGGSKDIEFWSSWKTPNTADVPKTLSGAPVGRESSTNWVEQFFGPGAVFNSAANPGAPDLGNWSWKYTLNFGSDAACPNDAYQWIDSAANGDGANITDGNILTPNATDCT